MADLSKEEKNARMSALLQLQDNISLQKNLPYEGEAFRVLVDSVEKGTKGEAVYTGRTVTNKLVHFKGDGLKVGEFAFVEIEKACPFDLIGKKKEG